MEGKHAATHACMPCSLMQLSTALPSSKLVVEHATCCCSAQFTRLCPTPSLLQQAYELEETVRFGGGPDQQELLEQRL